MLFGIKNTQKIGFRSIERPTEKQVFLITISNIAQMCTAKALLGPLQYLAAGESTKLGH